MGAILCLGFGKDNTLERTIMSLETAIAKLTEAVEANTAALSGGAAPAAKPAGKPAGKPAAKPAAGKKPAAKKGPTADDVAAAFGEYLKTGDKDERDTAKANVKAIITHFDVERITTLDPDNFKDALDYLEQFQNGENPFGEEEEEEEGEDLM